MFLFLSLLFVCFQLPRPLLILTSKTPRAVPTGRRPARHHSQAIANVSWRMLLLQKPLVLLSDGLFLVCPPHSKGMAPAVWRPLLRSKDYLLFHRSSSGSKQSSPDVAFITLSGTTIFFMGTLVFKVLSDHSDYKSFTYTLKSSYKTSSSRFIWSRWFSTWRNDLQTQVICPTSFE